MHLDENQIAKLEDFMTEVTESELSESLDRAIQQVSEGHIVPHEEVRKKYEKWL